jgi:hypothetical protein
LKGVHHHNDYSYHYSNNGRELRGVSKHEHTTESNDSHLHETHNDKATKNYPKKHHYHDYSYHHHSSEHTGVPHQYSNHKSNSKHYGRDSNVLLTYEGDDMFPSYSYNTNIATIRALDPTWKHDNPKYSYSYGSIPGGINQFDIKLNLKSNNYTYS